jgi:hypothetical protein
MLYRKVDKPKEPIRIMRGNIIIRAIDSLFWWYPHQSHKRPSLNQFPSERMLCRLHL